jgi:hypothetical protein
MKVIFIAALAMSLMVTGSALASPANPCGDGVTTMMPEGNLLVPEVKVTLTCPGFTFTSASVGTALFFDPNSAMPSDVVTLSNADGVATMAFLSDGELGLPPQLGIFTVNEPNPFVAYVVSTTGVTSKLTFTSDADNGTTLACGASDCVSASTVPEPATLGLLGIGLLGGGFMRRRRRSGPTVGEK